MSDVIDGHRERVRAADPLVAVTDLGGGADLIETRGAVGVPSVTAPRPGAPSVHWSPLTTCALDARVAGDDPAGSLGRLLDRWISGLDAEPGAGLVVSWPSRDTAPVAALVRRGFAPRSVLAVRVSRTAGRPAADARQAAERPGAGVRRAVAADLDAMCALYLELIDYEARFGWVPVPSWTAAAARAELAGKLARGDGWCWVAETDGEVTGMLSIHHPDHAGRVASAVAAASPVAYVGSLYGRPGSRGRGLGAALAGHAHAEVAAAGVKTVLVHYAAPNPLSVPFWSRQGYRPLVTTWGRWL
ncbi:GNAT family N-acetyltransferase [Nonomuraea rubra]|uniref:GNAT family N-acetyltransferase n=1 Tax=Nonomuraea rubra TaxID=46180 RepID=UPI0033C38A95